MLSLGRINQASPKVEGRRAQPEGGEKDVVQSFHDMADLFVARNVVAQKVRSMQMLSDK